MIKIAVFIKPQKVIKKKILYLKQDVKKKLEIDAKKVLTTDPYVKIDKNLMPLNEVINKSNSKSTIKVFDAL